MQALSKLKKHPKTSVFKYDPDVPESFTLLSILLSTD